MNPKAGRMALATMASLTFLAACTAPGPDCSGKVGNSKKECELESKSTRSPDNSNNPGN